MGKTKKIIAAGVISAVLAAGGPGMVKAAAVHTVQAGDTYWKLGQRYNVKVSELMEANNASSNMLYEGQKIIIPDARNSYLVQDGDTFWIIADKSGVDLQMLMQINNADANTVIYPGQEIRLPSETLTYTVQKGDTLWIISNKLGVNLRTLMEANDSTENTVIYPGQTLVIPKASIAHDSAKAPYITYTTHTVQKGDDFWRIGIKCGIPYQEVIGANGLNENSVLYIGQQLRIPVHNVPIKQTPGSRYGELLDWWTEAQYVWVIGENAKVTDFYTGVQWDMKRTIGANHADVEPLTIKDTETIKQVWGGEWSWKSRPVIVEVDGRKIAASASAMPHDIQKINDNGFDGHMDVHFLNSTRHKDGQIDEKHQQNIRIAAGN